MYKKAQPVYSILFYSILKYIIVLKNNQQLIVFLIFGINVN